MLHIEHVLGIRQAPQEHGLENVIGEQIVPNGPVVDALVRRGLAHERQGLQRQVAIGAVQLIQQQAHHLAQMALDREHVLVADETLAEGVRHLSPMLLEGVVGGRLGARGRAGRRFVNELE